MSVVSTATDSSNGTKANPCSRMTKPITLTQTAVRFPLLAILNEIIDLRTEPLVLKGPRFFVVQVLRLLIGALWLVSLDESKIRFGHSHGSCARSSRG